MSSKMKMIHVKTATTLDHIGMPCLEMLVVVVLLLWLRGHRVTGGWQCWERQSCMAGCLRTRVLLTSDSFSLSFLRSNARRIEKMRRRERRSDDEDDARDDSRASASLLLGSSSPSESVPPLR